MRGMRSSLPIFLFIGIAFIAVIGVIVLGAAATSASEEVNTTATDDLSIGIYTWEYGLMFGIGALLLLVAGYFALRGVL